MNEQQQTIEQLEAPIKEMVTDIETSIIVEAFAIKQQFFRTTNHRKNLATTAYGSIIRTTMTTRTNFRNS